MKSFFIILSLVMLSGCISMPEVKRVDKKIISQHIDENKDYATSQKEKYRKLQKRRDPI